MRYASACCNSRMELYRLSIVDMQYSKSAVSTSNEGKICQCWLKVKIVDALKRCLLDSAWHPVPDLHRRKINNAVQETAGYDSTLSKGVMESIEHEHRKTVTQCFNQIFLQLCKENPDLCHFDEKGKLCSDKDGVAEKLITPVSDYATSWDAVQHSSGQALLTSLSHCSPDARLVGLFAKLWPDGVGCALWKIVEDVRVLKSMMATDGDHTYVKGRRVGQHLIDIFKKLHDQSDLKAVETVWSDCLKALLEYLPDNALEELMVRAVCTDYQEITDFLLTKISQSENITLSELEHKKMPLLHAILALSHRCMLGYNSNKAFESFVNALKSKQNGLRIIRNVPTEVSGENRWSVIDTYCGIEYCGDSLIVCEMLLKAGALPLKAKKIAAFFTSRAKSPLEKLSDEQIRRLSFGAVYCLWLSDLGHLRSTDEERNRESFSPYSGGECEMQQDSHKLRKPKRLLYIAAITVTKYFCREEEAKSDPYRKWLVSEDTAKLTQIPSNLQQQLTAPQLAYSLSMNSA